MRTHPWAAGVLLLASAARADERPTLAVLPLLGSAPMDEKELVDDSLRNIALAVRIYDDAKGDGGFVSIGIPLGVGYQWRTDNGGYFRLGFPMQLLEGSF